MQQGGTAFCRLARSSRQYRFAAHNRIRYPAASDRWPEVHQASCRERLRAEDVRATTGTLAATRRRGDAAKRYLRDRFDALGLEYVSGAGNFSMVRMPRSETLLSRKLPRKGVIGRTMTGFCSPNRMRVSLTQEQAREAFATLPKVVDHA